MWYVTRNGNLSGVMADPLKTAGVILFSPFVDYEQAIAVVHDRYNYNHTNWSDILNVFDWDFDRVEADELDKVFSCYMALCRKGEIPEYEPWASKGMDRVAQCSGVRAKKVQDILYELYYATLDGSVRSSEFIHPLTYQKDAENRQSQTTVSRATQAIEDTASVLKWALILGGIGLAGYYIWQWWPSSDTEEKSITLNG